MKEMKPYEEYMKDYTKELLEDFNKVINEKMNEAKLFSILSESNDSKEFADKMIEKTTIIDEYNNEKYGPEIARYVYSRLMQYYMSYHAVVFSIKDEDYNKNFWNIPEGFLSELNDYPELFEFDFESETTFMSFNLRANQDITINKKPTPVFLDLYLSLLDYTHKSKTYRRFIIDFNNKYLGVYLIENNNQSPLDCGNCDICHYFELGSIKYPNAKPAKIKKIPKNLLWTQLSNCRFSELKDQYGNQILKFNLINMINLGLFTIDAYINRHKGGYKHIEEWEHAKQRKSTITILDNSVEIHDVIYSSIKLEESNTEERYIDKNYPTTHASPKEHYRRGTIVHRNGKTFERRGCIVNKGNKQLKYEVK